MKAVRCDRCKQYFPITEENTVFNNVIGVPTTQVELGGISFERMANNMPVYAQTMDLCPKCRESLIRWWNGHDKG